MVLNVCIPTIQEGSKVIRRNQNKSPQERFLEGALVSGISVREVGLRWRFSQPIDFIWWSQRGSNPCFRRERPAS